MLSITSSSFLTFISDAVIGFRIIRISEGCRSPVIFKNNVFSGNFRLVTVYGVRAIDVQISLSKQCLTIITANNGETAINRKSLSYTDFHPWCLQSSNAYRYKALFFHILHNFQPLMQLLRHN